MSVNVFEMGLAVSTKFKAACLLQRSDSLVPEIDKSLPKPELLNFGVKRQIQGGTWGWVVWEGCTFLVSQPVGKRRGKRAAGSLG